MRVAAFDGPYRQLLASTLVHVLPVAGHRAKRLAFARIAHFSLQSTGHDERVIADVLEAVMACTDHANVVRYLLCGVWHSVGGDERNLRWCTKVADRALEQGHLAGFLAAVQLLVHMPGFEGHLSAAWFEGIQAARESEPARQDLFWLGLDWIFMFHPAGGPPPPEWLVGIRTDPRVEGSVANVVGDRNGLRCPHCGEPFTAGT
jgi:hypothetical protein